MQAFKEVQMLREPERHKASRRRDVFFKDLDLLISVAIARFLVWRKLRRMNQERALRLKQLKLIHGGNHSVMKRAIPIPRNQEGAVRMFGPG